MGIHLGLECVHESVHVFMSIWLPVSSQTPMHSYTETRVALCGSVFFVPFTSFLLPQLVWNVYMHWCMYLCQSEFWIQLHPLCIVTWKHGCYCVALCVLQWSHFGSQTLVRMCTCISIYTILPTLLPNVCFHSISHTYMDRWLSSVWHCVCLPVISICGPTS